MYDDISLIPNNAKIAILKEFPAPQPKMGLATEEVTFLIRLAPDKNVVFSFLFGAISNKKTD